MSENEQFSDEESEFGIEEIFVSKTDKRGVIEFGNDVFIRVSEYASDELVGQPHNKIRHPDMPKCIFKLFWSYLKSDRPVVAFVKNRSRSGRYYWVLAAAFPRPDGYFSIRIKPSSPLLAVVQDLYKELSIFENEHDTETTAKRIQQALIELNFSNYDDFMVTALMTELASRRSKIAQNRELALNLSAKKQARNAVSRSYDELRLKSLEAADTIQSGLYNLRDYAGFLKVIITSTENIASECKKLDALAINTVISAHKLGRDGVTLSVIASAFQKASREVVSLQHELSLVAQALHAGMRPSLFGTGLSVLQIEMLSQFAVEAEKQSVRVDFDVEASRRTADQANQLLTNFTDYVQTTRSELLEFFGQLNIFERRVKEFTNLMDRLDAVRAGGRLESSRSQQTQSSFQPFIAQMASAVQNMNEPLQQMTAQIHHFSEGFEHVALGAHRLAHTVGELELIERSIRSNTESAIVERAS